MLQTIIAALVNRPLYDLDRLERAIFNLLDDADYLTAAKVGDEWVVKRV